MAEGNKCNTVNQKFLPLITKPKEIKDLDWCEYVFECLKKTKSEWNRNSHFNGPIVFLMVLFAHETVKDEEYALPLIKNWSSEKFKAIQAEKIKNSELKKELVGEEAKQSSAMKKRKIGGNQKSRKRSLMEQKMDDDEDNEHENGESQRQNNESEEDLENNKEENLDGHEQDDESDEKDEDEVEGMAKEKQISQEQIDEEETNLDEDEKEDESDENNEEKGEVKANEDQISREESNDKAGKANNEQVEKEDTEFQFIYDNLFGEIQSLEDFNTFTDESIVQKTCEAEDCKTVQKRKRGRSPMSQAERPNDLQKGISCSKRADQHILNTEYQQVWPFIKQSALWATIESLESYRQLPQKPHFSPLKKVKADHREGLAISHVVTFENLVQKILKIQLTDPADIIKDSLESLVDLETHGFDVGAVRARLNELLSWKDKVGQLRDMARKDEESQKCEQEEMNQLEVRIKEFQKKMEENEMMKNTKNEKVMKLQSNLCLLSKQIIDCELAFKKLAATPL